MFAQFERRLRIEPADLPGFHPYWEDGSASSGRGDRLNRPSGPARPGGSFWAYACPRDRIPPGDYDVAWRTSSFGRAHLGARHLASPTPTPSVKEQWSISASRLDADRISQHCSCASRSAGRAPGSSGGNCRLISATRTSWPRTDVVFLPATQAKSPTQCSMTMQCPSSHASPPGSWSVRVEDVAASLRPAIVVRPGRPEPGKLPRHRKPRCRIRCSRISGPRHGRHSQPPGTRAAGGTG